MDNRKILLKAAELIVDGHTEYSCSAITQAVRIMCPTLTPIKIHLRRDYAAFYGFDSHLPVNFGKDARSARSLALLLYREALND